MGTRRTWRRPWCAIPPGVRRAVALVLAGCALYGAGFGTAWKLATANGSALPATARGDVPLLWQAWNIAQEHYVDQRALEPRKMIYGAIQGMLGSLGDTDHTRFLTPTEVQQERSQLSGKFVGIGIRIHIKDDRPVILAPLPNSPAKKAGLQTGDVILKVNDVDTASLSLTQLSAQILGPEGTVVRLQLLRPGEGRTFDVALKRAAIVTSAVEVHDIESGGKHVLHAHVTQFSANADDQLRAALHDVKGHLDGLVLDLRDNPGGLLDQAISVTSEFLTSGTVVLEAGRDGVEHADTVKPGGVAPTIPLVVLINEGTASAAEITAGALKDHQRGQIVGVTTFGTGTVLNDFALSDGSEVLLGTEEWLTPNGTLIWHHGISPDQEVRLPSDVTPSFPDAEEGKATDELLHSTDAQLVRALRLLLP